MKFALSGILCLAITLSGLCSGMGVFAMEQHISEMETGHVAHAQAGDHSAHSVIQDAPEHTTLSIDSSVPLMACCEAPHHQENAGHMSESSFFTDSTPAKTPSIVIETEPIGADGAAIITHHPNDFERRSLAKRE